MFDDTHWGIDGVLPAGQRSARPATVTGKTERREPRPHPVMVTTALSWWWYMPPAGAVISTISPSSTPDAAKRASRGGVGWFGLLGSLLRRTLTTVGRLADGRLQPVLLGHRQISAD
jgi:hypothetical protein